MKKFFDRFGYFIVSILCFFAFLYFCETDSYDLFIAANLEDHIISVGISVAFVFLCLFYFVLNVCLLVVEAIDFLLKQKKTSNSLITGEELPEK